VAPDVFFSHARFFLTHDDRMHGDRGRNQHIDDGFSAGRFPLGAIVRLHALRRCTHFGRELMTAFRAQAPLQLWRQN
jgi:hypothetical protein